MSDPRPPELYDTKTNPRVRWSCRRCQRRNDAPLSIPVAKVETKYCKFCRFRIAFKLEKLPAPEGAKAGTSVTEDTTPAEGPPDAA